MQHGVRPLGMVRLSHFIFTTDNFLKGLQMLRCEVTNERKRVVPERAACLRITIRPMHSTSTCMRLGKSFAARAVRMTRPTTSHCEWTISILDFQRPLAALSEEAANLGRSGFTLVSINPRRLGTAFHLSTAS